MAASSLNKAQSSKPRFLENPLEKLDSNCLSVVVSLLKPQDFTNMAMTSRSLLENHSAQNPLKAGMQKETKKIFAIAGKHIAISGPVLKELQDDLIGLIHTITFRNYKEVENKIRERIFHMACFLSPEELALLESDLLARVKPGLLKNLCLEMLGIYKQLMAGVYCDAVPTLIKKNQFLVAADLVAEFYHNPTGDLKFIAQACLAKKKFREAVEIANKMTSGTDRNDIIRQIITPHLENGQFDKTLQFAYELGEYDKCVEAIDTYIWMKVCGLFYQDQFNEALELTKQLHKGIDSQMRRVLIEEHCKRGLIEKAIELVQTMPDREPGYYIDSEHKAIALHRICQALCKLGQPERAMEFIPLISKERSEWSAFALNEVVNVWTDMGRVDKAIPLVRNGSFINKGSSYGHACHHIARALCTARFDEAIEIANLVTSIYEKSHVLTDIVESLVKQKNSARALQVIEMIPVANWKETAIQVLFGGLCDASGIEKATALAATLENADHKKIALEQIEKAKK